MNLGACCTSPGDCRRPNASTARAHGGDATLLFNLGVLLEDMNRTADAMSAYREALDLDATFADAHFNLARLYEREHNRRETLRHLLAYRRLTR